MHRLWNTYSHTHNAMGNDPNNNHKPKGQSRMDNPETLDTQDTGRRQTKHKITQTPQKKGNTDKKYGLNRYAHEMQAVPVYFKIPTMLVMLSKKITGYRSFEHALK